MKRIFTIVCLLLLTVTVWAQAPQKVSFQAVVRNSTGALVALKPVGIRVSIIQTSEFGPSIYVETHTVNTNLNALLSINIGGGTAVVGTFATIDWSKGPYFLKTEMDPNGGTSYSITGTQQLMSVPYAIYTGRAMVADSINLIAGNGINITKNKIGTAWSSNSSGPYTDSLMVGIGTRSPMSKLHVSGSQNNLITSNFEGDGWNSFYRYNRYLGYIGVWNDSSSLDFGTSGSGTNVNIVTGASPRLTVTASGNVGIGFTDPSETLDVNGKTRTADLQVTNGAGAGKVLTSDVSGNATWTTAKQIVGFFPLNGFLGSGPYNSMAANTYAFMGPTQTITITSTGDIITGSAQVPMATQTLVATVQFGMGYQLQPSGTITNFTGGSYSIVEVGTERNSHCASASVTNLAPGTYKVGVVLNNTSTTAISDNDFVNGYFMLLR